MVPLISCWTFLCCYFFWSRRWLPLDLKPPSRHMTWLRPCRHSTGAGLRHLSECHSLVHRHTHRQPWHHVSFSWASQPRGGYNPALSNYSGPPVSLKLPPLGPSWWPLQRCGYPAGLQLLFSSLQGPSHRHSPWHSPQEMCLALAHLQWITSLFLDLAVVAHWSINAFLCNLDCFQVWMRAMEKLNRAYV